MADSLIANYPESTTDKHPTFHLLVNGAVIPQQLSVCIVGMVL